MIEQAISLLKKDELQQVIELLNSHPHCPADFQLMDLAEGLRKQNNLELLNPLFEQYLEQVIAVCVYSLYSLARVEQLMPLYAARIIDAIIQSPKILETLFESTDDPDEILQELCKKYPRFAVQWSTFYCSNYLTIRFFDLEEEESRCDILDLILGIEATVASLNSYANSIKKDIYDSMSSKDNQSLSVEWKNLVNSLVLDEGNISKMKYDSAENKRYALHTLNQFVSEYNRYMKSYFQIAVQRNLTVKDYQFFIQKIAQITSNAAMGLALNASKEMISVIKIIQRSYQWLQLKSDMIAEKEAKNRDTMFSMVNPRKYTDRTVVNAGLKVLFDWAESIEQSLLNDIISELIKTVYQDKTFFSGNRCTEYIKQHYLKTSKESGDNKLGYILSFNGGNATALLNEVLIKKLFELALRDSVITDSNLLPLVSALTKNDFDITHYVRCATEYAQSDARFTHVYANSSLIRLNKTIYRWVNNIERSGFIELVNKVFAEYKPSWWGTFFTDVINTNTKRREIQNLIKNPSLTNQQILALLFKERSTGGNSFVSILFKKVLDAIQQIGNHIDNDLDWIQNITFDDHTFPHFLHSLPIYASQYTERRHDDPTSLFNIQSELQTSLIKGFKGF